MIPPTLRSLSPDVGEAYDTTTPSFANYLNEVEEWYSGQADTYEILDREARADEGSPGSFGFRIALKIAESRRLLAALDQQVTITLVNPVYKETGRILPRSEHPHGEDSIRVKAESLLAIEGLNPGRLRCRLVVVDDECPAGSGELAAEILRADYPQRWDDGSFGVFSLRDAIDGGDSDTPPGLTHKDGANRSVKGGALLFGMKKALHHQSGGLHVVVDNDADLSIHPMQLGLLVDPIASGSVQAVAGSRREEDSVALIGGSRDTRGQLFIKIWQHFLPALAGRVTDTNRAFKAFNAEALQEIIDGIEIYTFPYQIELLQACISNGIALQKRGIAYVDSEAASTQQGEGITETYLNQVRQIIDIAQRYKAIPSDDPLLRFFEEVSEERWAEIEAAPPEDLGDLLRVE